MDEIADKIGVAKTTLISWAGEKDDHGRTWAMIRKDYQVELADQTEATVRNIIQRNKARVMKDDLKLSDKIRKHVHSTLDDGWDKHGKSKIDTATLKSVSSIAKATSDMNTRIVQLDGAGKSGQTLNFQNSLIQIGAQPVPAPELPAPPIIDVEPVHDEELVDEDDLDWGA